MSAEWVVYVAAVGTLLAFAAAALAAALGPLGRPARWVFAAALAGIAGLAAIAPRRPSLVVRMVPDATIASVPGAVAVHLPTFGDRARFARAVSSALEVVGPLVRRVSPTITRSGRGAWTMLSGALVLLFALVHARLTVARRRWPLHSIHGTTVRVAPAIGPAVLGLFRPEIVVPRWLLDRPDEEQRLILAHEREHLRAGDHALLSAAWLCAIAFPWHPAVWYLVNRVRLAIELDCDARVLRSGASPSSYCGLLIDVAAQQRALRIGALALADGPSHLERRILAMRSTKGRHIRLRGLLLGAVGGLLVLAACEAKVPTAADVASMDVAALEKKAAQLGLPDANVAKADYFVNGAPVTADSARSIVAEKIGSVEVVKSQSVGGRDTIFVATTDVMPRLGDGDGAEQVTQAVARAFGRNALLVIDDVVQPHGIKAPLDPKDITSISIMKPGKNPQYPNGLIAIETKRPRR